MFKISFSNLFHQVFLVFSPLLQSLHLSLPKSLCSIERLSESDGCFELSLRFFSEFLALSLVKRTHVLHLLVQAHWVTLVVVGFDLVLHFRLQQSVDLLPSVALLFRRLERVVQNLTREKLEHSSKFSFVFTGLSNRKLVLKLTQTFCFFRVPIDGSAFLQLLKLAI